MAGEGSVVLEFEWMVQIVRISKRRRKEVANF